VFGHKPTWALCPNYGDPDTTPASVTDISVIGPLARSARDLDLALGVLAAPDPAETALTLSLPAPRTTSPAGLRVAVWSEQAGQPTDPATIAQINGLADFLEREGAVVSRTARPAFDPAEAYRLYLQLLAAAWSGRMSDQAVSDARTALAGLAAEDTSADAVMLRTGDLPHRTWLGLHERRCRLRLLWSAFFREWDVLLCPVITTAALPHMQEGTTRERRLRVNGAEMAYNDMLFWPGLTGGYHLPATVAPLGVDGTGLPLGVQIVGPVYGDRTTIAVAGLLERHWRGFTAPPGWA
jgi:amidase